MDNHKEINRTGRDLRSIAAELKRELKEFVDTRIAMFKNEFREKVSHWKIAAPLAGLGVVLIATAYLLITLSLVALVAVFIPNEYRWFIASLAVGILWGLLGAISVYVAKREFDTRGLMPQKTIEILKGDKVWFQQEARNQI